MAPDTALYIAAVDDTESASHVVEVAAGIARSMGPAELHLIHVIDVPGANAVPSNPLTTLEDRIDHGRVVLDALRAEAQGRFGGRVVGHLAAGEPWREIVQLAASLGADLLVVGTNDRTGLKRLVLGSVAERVTRKAQCPVLVARRKDYHVRVDPQIEPPCPDCVEVQRATNREKLWCKRHYASHPRGATHYELPEGFGAGSMLLRP